MPKIMVKVAEALFHERLSKEEQTAVRLRYGQDLNAWYVDRFQQQLETLHECVQGQEDKESLNETPNGNARSPSA